MEDQEMEASENMKNVTVVPRKRKGNVTMPVGLNCDKGERKKSFTAANIGEKKI